LATTSIAPSQSAESAHCVPFAVEAEQTTTGIGSSRHHLPQKSSPCILGISRSSTITSGRSRFILSIAMSGSARHRHAHVGRAREDRRHGLAHDGRVVDHEHVEEGFGGMIIGRGTPRSARAAVPGQGGRRSG
jgi:hypothetical protein